MASTQPDLATRHRAWHWELRVHHWPPWLPLGPLCLLHPLRFAFPFTAWVSLLKCQFHHDLYVKLSERGLLPSEVFSFGLHSDNMQIKKILSNNECYDEIKQDRARKWLGLIYMVSGKALLRRQYFHWDLNEEAASYVKIWEKINLSRWNSRRPLSSYLENTGPQGKGKRTGVHPILVAVGIMEPWVYGKGFRSYFIDNDRILRRGVIWFGVQFLNISLAAM